MEDKGKKLFVRRSAGGNIFIVCSLLFIAAVFAAVLLLIQARNSKALIEPGDGFGRNSMFPFVYTSQEGSLYIINDDSLKVNEIDDTVSECIHDVEDGSVYYLRDKVLYKYSVSKGRRKALAGGVASYSLSAGRSFIVLVSEDGSLRFHDGKKETPLTETGAADGRKLYSVGKNHVLFVKDYDPETSEGVIHVCDAAGKVRSTGIKADCSRMFFFSEEDTKIISYLGRNMTVSDIKGKILFTGSDYSCLTDTEQPLIYGDFDPVISINENVNIGYFMKITEETGLSTLCMLRGSDIQTVSENVSSVIYCNSEANLILYTVRLGESLYIYKKSDGKPEKQLTCPEGTEFVFDSGNNYLYYRLPEGKLYRYNVYDVSLTSVSVSDNAGKLYAYNNKNIVAYSVPESDNICLVLDDNSVSPYNTKKESHLYGRGSSFVLIRLHGDGIKSLDIQGKNGIARISDNISGNVYFDKDFKYIFYVSDNTLYCCKDKNAAAIGSFGNIEAVKLALAG